MVDTEDFTVIVVYLSLSFYLLYGWLQHLNSVTIGWVQFYTESSSISGGALINLLKRKAIVPLFGSSKISLVLLVSCTPTAHMFSTVSYGTQLYPAFDCTLPLPSQPKSKGFLKYHLRHSTVHCVELFR